ncbi:MAG: class II fructose-bisphosphate aldolase [Balneolaceae bacterium]|nr:class II fructose-bisphosphate aldolase [Balneolaceae bacterium]MCH8548431.1 class II fructose-bisphosphate aldolase [Balneolaceae bacterium]
MTLKQKFSQLEDQKSALLAANFYNYETVTGVLRAASAMDMPIILQASPSTIRYLGAEVAACMALKSMEKFGVEGWLHLDHAESIETIQACLDAGFDSVMIDASEKSFDENVKITSKVVSLAEKYGANVEAELGYVAKLGQSHEKEGFTNPGEAREFTEKTGINALAVAIGSAHGFYRKEPDLDLDRLSAIKKECTAALVLHGGSGIPDAQIQEGIRRGIRKINVATELKDAFMNSLQGELTNNSEIDLRKVFPPAVEAVSKLVQQKMNIILNA